MFYFFFLEKCVSVDIVYDIVYFVFGLCIVSVFGDEVGGGRFDDNSGVLCMVFFIVFC